MLSFLFNATATTEIYTLSLHDALPICDRTDADEVGRCRQDGCRCWRGMRRAKLRVDRKSTRLNSSHLGISYAVFCLKKKKRSRRSAVLHRAEPPPVAPRRTRSQ